MVYEITDLGGAVYHALAKNNLESISTIDSTAREDAHCDPILALLAGDSACYEACLYFKDRKGVPKIEVTHNPKKNVTTITRIGSSMDFGIARELVGICKKAMPQYDLMRRFHKTYGNQRDAAFYSFENESPKRKSALQVPMYVKGESVDEFCGVTQ